MCSREKHGGTGMMEHSRHIRSQEQTHQGERKNRVSEDTTTKRSDDRVMETYRQVQALMPEGVTTLLQNDEGEGRKPG
jgi:hypothetical protein